MHPCLGPTRGSYGCCRSTLKPITILGGRDVSARIPSLGRYRIVYENPELHERGQRYFQREPSISSEIPTVLSMRTFLFEAPWVGADSYRASGYNGGALVTRKQLTVGHDLETVIKGKKVAVFSRNQDESSGRIWMTSATSGSLEVWGEGDELQRK